MSRTRSVVATLGAGVLVLALVVAPPDATAEREAPRAVQPTVLTFSPAAAITALQRFAGPSAAERLGVQISPQNQSDTGTVQRLVAAPTAALALPTPGDVIGTLFGPLLRNPVIAPILGPIILFGPIIALVILACPPCALVNFIGGIIRSFLIELAPVGIAAATATVEPVAEAAALPDETVPEVSSPPARTVNEMSSRTEGLNPDLLSAPDLTEGIEEQSPEPIVDDATGDDLPMDEEGALDDIDDPTTMETGEEEVSGDLAGDDGGLVTESVDDADDADDDHSTDGPADTASEGDESPGNDAPSE